MAIARAFVTSSRLDDHETWRYAFILFWFVPIALSFGFHLSRYL
jgi:hypothetical protein